MCGFDNVHRSGTGYRFTAFHGGKTTVAIGKEGSGRDVHLRELRRHELELHIDGRVGVHLSREVSGWSAQYINKKRHQANKNQSS